MGKVFSGEINPSGRTVDTFEVDASQSAAAQNFGDYGMLIQQASGRTIIMCLIKKAFM